MRSPKGRSARQSGLTLLGSPPASHQRLVAWYSVCRSTLIHLRRKFRSPFFIKDVHTVNQPKTGGQRVVQLSLAKRIHSLSLRRMPSKSPFFSCTAYSTTWLRQTWRYPLGSNEPIRSATLAQITDYAKLASMRIARRAGSVDQSRQGPAQLAGHRFFPLGSEPRGPQRRTAGGFPQNQRVKRLCQVRRLAVPGEWGSR